MASSCSCLKNNINEIHSYKLLRAMGQHGLEAGCRCRRGGGDCVWEMLEICTALESGALQALTVKILSACLEDFSGKLSKW
jgi:hypothetical protein